MGRIFIRLPDVPKVVELFVGATERDILDICHKKSPSAGTGASAPPRASAQNPPLGPSHGDSAGTWHMSRKKDKSTTKGFVTNQPKPKPPQGDSREDADEASPGASSGVETSGVRPSSSKSGPGGEPHSLPVPVPASASLPASAGPSVPAGPVPGGPALVGAMSAGPASSDPASTGSSSAAAPLAAGPASASPVSGGAADVAAGACT